MSDLLFEIGTEELPPSLIENLTNQIKSNIASELKGKNIEVKEDQIKTFSSPRRIAIKIKDLPKIQEVKELEVKGPDKTKAFTDGKPTQAAIGFAKKYNLEPKDFKIKEVNGSEYVFVSVRTGGEEVISILSDILPNSLRKTTGDKFMKWGSYEEKFARPVRWLTALLDENVIPFTYAGLKSSNKTTPHRFNTNKFLEIKSPNEYEKVLQANNTICDKAKRKEIIQNLLIAKSNEAGLVPLVDESLLNEVANITEDPAALICQFDDKYLALPECVIETVLRKHQKYFVLKDKNNKLTSKFIVITNGTGKEDNIKRGNEKVVRARLNDAKFFYEEDLKRPFTYEERIKDLSKITFQKGLGSMQEKVERIAQLSKHIFKVLSLTSSDKEEDVLAAAKLCKLDLVTHMVFEMPELQGKIGAVYATKNGFNATISESIEFQYSIINELNTTSQIVSLADKIDNLICLFSIGKIPTSSADPFGLRIQTQGIFHIIRTIERNHKIDLPLLQTINTYIDDILNKEIKSKLSSENRKKLEDFLTERLKLSLIPTLNKDFIDAAFLVRQPLNAIGKTREVIIDLSTTFETPSESSKQFLQAAKRLVRIVDKDTNGITNIELLKTKEESELLNKFKDLEGKQFKSNKEYLSALIELATPINLFFDKVLVNDPDPEIKKARQGLLKRGKTLFEKVCDFNQIIERN